MWVILDRINAFISFNISVVSTVSHEGFSIIYDNAEVHKEVDTVTRAIFSCDANDVVLFLVTLKILHSAHPHIMGLPAYMYTHIYIYSMSNIDKLHVERTTS